MATLEGLMAGQSALSRRGLLALGAGTLATLAGCQSVRSRTKRPETTTMVPSTFPGSVSVEGRNLVVDFSDDHDIETIRLIDPDGRLFGSRPVPTGVRRVEFELLDPKLLGSDYDHYEPGVYDVLAIDSDEDVFRHSIALQPDIRVLNVEQYRAEDGPALAKIRLTVENTGTAPVWLYDMSFQESPYWGANEDLDDSIGLPRFSSPTVDEFHLLEPMQTARYVSFGRPLLFETQSDCSDQIFQFEVNIGVSTGQVLRETVTIRTGGEPRRDILRDRWACTVVEIRTGA